MKQNKILKSVLICLILAISFLFAGCKGPNYVNTSYRYNDKDYKTGNFAYKDSVIKEINIDYIVGDIEIYPSTNDNELIIQEDIDMDSEDKYRVHHKLTNDSLDIRFCANLSILRRKFNLKRVRIYIPKGIDNININSVNAEVNLLDITTKNINIESVSGDIDIKNVNLDSIKVNTTSASTMIFNSVIANNTLKTVSGDLGLSYLKLPESLDIYTVSASITLYVKPDDDLTFRFTKVSGKVNTKLQFKVDGDVYILNEMKNIFDIQTVSGRLSVLTK